LLTAHHLDDQAETLLLQLFRGAGVQGLAAMGEIGILGEGCIARPFLSHSRKQLEEYARDHQLHWVDDESNQDINYSRNFLRHQIMPLLSSKWPGVTGNLARTALHCQQAATNLEDLALLDSPELENTLWIKPLKTLSMPRIINVLRVWLKKNQIRLPSSLTLQRLIDEMIGASPDAQPVVQWAKIKICRYQEHLYIIKADAALQSCTEWSNFPSPLILANNGVLHASQVSQGLVIPKDTKLAIKYRQGGELLFWHGQNKQLKKLFQEWGIPPWLRERIPLLFINEQLVAVVGYAVSDLFYSQNSSEAWQLSITQAR
jgi:tRNA(Ile)-lysidine synthase